MEMEQCRKHEYFLHFRMCLNCNHILWYSISCFSSDINNLLLHFSFSSSVLRFLVSLESILLKCILVSVEKDMMWMMIIVIPVLYLIPNCVLSARIQRNMLKLGFSGQMDLDKDIYSKSDPYLVLYRNSHSGEWTPIRTSETIKVWFLENNVLW